MRSQGVVKAQGARPPPIEMPPMIKNYDNIAKQCLVAVTDDEGAPGPLTNKNGAPGPPTKNQGAPGPLTNNQGALGPLTENQGALIDNQGAPGPN